MVFFKERNIFLWFYIFIIPNRNVNSKKNVLT